MSCPLDRILDKESNKQIDDGVDFLAKKIETIKKIYEIPDSGGESSMFEGCSTTKLDKGVLWANIALQITLLVFLGIIAATKGEKDWSIDALTWVSWVTLALLLIQYRDVVFSMLKLFIHGVDLQTQIISVLTLVIVIMTRLLYVNEGFTVSIVALMIFVLIAVRVGFQIKSTLQSDSMVTIMLDFINRLITPNRIQKIKKAFD